METKKTYAPHELQPSTPIHPGEILKDELESRGMSQRKFAAVIGISYSVSVDFTNSSRNKRSMGKYSCCRLYCFYNGNHRNMDTYQKNTKEK